MLNDMLVIFDILISWVRTCIHTGVIHAIGISIEMFYKMIILLEYIDHYTYEMQI